ncbi:alpha/beta hydrolase [Vibrio panuliri]|uniref:Lipase n=1 Tax=Vibrio panuliri TaxID=1381081 RepID=A0ABX3FPH1_9VIBR|nr:alpha/beta hydrolase [Vibrio panuliri]KAB1454503.1 alpha/beta hydrolase [Vibrio panuliri]OLQ94934.1 lipase [Vibrio panuliri]
MTKHLELGIKELVDDFIASGKPCPAQQDIHSRRSGYLASTILAGANVEMYQEFVDVLDGIEVKIYQPSAERDLPITVYFHGGCFISGGFATHDVQLRQLAFQANSLVICIRYRLAPEHIYPAAHEDAYNGALGIAKHGRKYGGDTDNIVFAGDSAGGQLALATTLRLKQNQQWLPRKQILIYPMLDPNGESNSYASNGTDYVITAKMLLSGFQLYAADKEVLNRTAELNLLAADFQGIPPTHIITAEYDPLRDEGERLYKLMLEQGVDASCQRYLGTIHGFFQLGAVSKSARRCLTAIAAEIAR